jgi:hypothetical protein
MLTNEQKITNMKIRRDNLQKRDPVSNVNIIRKLNRNIRNLEKRTHD